MRVLVTRPEPDASDLGREIVALGHEAVLSPMLEISYQPPHDFPRGMIQALILTSRNAARALAASPLLPGLLDLPVFAVGQKTGEEAHVLGFHGVISGPGTAADLADIIISHADPAGGRLVHLAGYKLAFDLAGALEARGFAVDTVVCYRAEEARSLSPAAEPALRDGLIDVAMLMSPATARCYLRLVTEAHLTSQARKVAYACISEATAAALKELGPQNIEVAKKQNSTEMLALVKRMTAKSQ